MSRAWGFHALRPPKRGKTPRPVVFLDRDGTIIHDRPGFYLHRPEQVKLYAGALRALRRLRDAGFELVVVTNQSGLGRGFLDRPTLAKVHDRLLKQLRKGGVELAGIYFCPHHPKDGCACRKPSPVMARAAVKRHHLTLEGGFVVGDKRADVDLAHALGLGSVHLGTGHGRDQRAKHGSALKPDFHAASLAGAVKKILSVSPLSLQGRGWREAPGEGPDKKSPIPRKAKGRR